MSKTIDEWIYWNEVADIVPRQFRTRNNYPPRAVQDLCRAGYFPNYVRLSVRGRPLFRKADVERFVVDMAETARPPT
jgi:hypothetical protein